MRATLLLNQPVSGVPGENSSTEIRAIVKLTQSGRMIKSVNYNNLEDVKARWGTFGEMAIQGIYSIESDDFTQNSDSYTIGGSEPSIAKYWGYNIAHQMLVFMTFENWTGGGAMSNENAPVKVKQDLVLYNVKITKNGFEPINPPDIYNGFQTGFVHVKSWIKPFEKRNIYWIDN
jgi:hypothetical protein